MAISERHAEWLEARGLDVEVAAAMGVRSNGPAIAFPYLRSGVEVYAKTRRGNDKSTTRCVPAGVDQDTLWQEDCLKDDPQPGDPLIITEGEPDAIAVRQNGFQFVVSLPSGAASTAEGCRSKAERVLTVEGEGGRRLLKADIEKFDRIVILTDCDHDGLLMRDAIADLVGHEYAWLPTYPEGAKDANEVQQKNSGQAVRDLVEKARPLKDDGFTPFMDAFKATRVPPVFECGLDFLEPHLKLTSPEFFVIGGRAGEGKSTAIQVLVFELCWAHGWRASIFHGEGSRLIPVQRAMRFWYRRTKTARGEGKAERDAWINDKLAFIAPPQDQAPTFEWLLWAMERQALYRGVKVFVVDPWNEILLNVPKNQNKTDAVAEAIIQMKRLADRHGLILIVGHHCRIPREDRPPNKYDLSDSQHWANKADHVMLVWRPYEDVNAVRLHVEKSKDHETMGRPGSVWVQYVPNGAQLVTVPDPIAARREAAKAERDARKDQGKKGNGFARDSGPIAEMM